MANNAGSLLSVSISHSTVCIAESGASVSAFTGLTLLGLDGLSCFFFLVLERDAPDVVIIVILNSLNHLELTQSSMSHCSMDRKLGNSLIN